VKRYQCDDTADRLLRVTFLSGSTTLYLTTYTTTSDNTTSHLNNTTIGNSVPTIPAPRRSRMVVACDRKLLAVLPLPLTSGVTIAIDRTL
jgi:hypothetical protein